jgi:hypothetical protein
MGERLVTLAGQKDNSADNQCPAEVKGCYGFARRPFVTGIPHLWLLNVLVPCATQRRLRIAPTACPSLVSPCYENRTYSALEDVCGIIMMVTRTRYVLLVRARVTTINAMPPPSSTRCGLRKASQTASGGHKILASRSASRQASTPERNPTAVATRRFFSGLISNVWGRGLERIDPRHALPDDQRMHVMRAFVSLDRLQVHQVAHDGIVVGDAVGAEDIA